MTRPGPPPPRGRHAAPDDDARPDEAAPAGRHAAPDPPQRRHAAADQGHSDPPQRRRHAVPDESGNGVAYHRPSLGNNIRYHRPDPYAGGVHYGPDPSPDGLASYGPDPSPNGYSTPDANRAGYHGRGEGPNDYPPPGSGRHRPEPNGYSTPDANRAGSSGRDDSANGYPAPGAGRHRPEPSPNGHAGSAANQADHYGPEPSANGYPSPRGGAQHRSEPSPHGYTDANGIDYRPEPRANGYAGGSEVGHRRPEPGRDGYPAPGADLVGYHRPGANGTGYHRAAPAAGDLDTTGYRRAAPAGDLDRAGYRRSAPADGDLDRAGYHRADRAAADLDETGTRHRRAEWAGADPGGNGVAYHRPEPGAHRYGGAEAPPHPWPETNGYHLESPAPPAVNGYRLDEPVAPVTGFPYSAPPSTPTAYPVNGHGVDAAERDAVSWPVNGNATAWPVDGNATAWPVDGNATAWPVDGHPTELYREPDPQIAVVPLNDEPTEVLDRPEPKPAAGKSPTPPHAPRAVVRRRQARRRALEWPFLIVFAIVSAFLIRQYVVQTFYIPSASMHETLIEGDRVLVNKVGYHLHDIHRGDVVVFRKPPNLDVSEDDLIKRVVALPGETVEGRGGRVYVNGAPLDEPYVEPLCHGTGDFAKVTVPAGTLWVMGDNRCNSSDSRVFGPIDRNLVVGRAVVIAWPFDRLSWL